MSRPVTPAPASTMPPACRGLALAILTGLATLALAGLGHAQVVIVELSSQPHPRQVVADFERTALAMRNATDAAFLGVKRALSHLEDAENATDAVDDAISEFYFTVTSTSLNATQALPIPEGLGEEVTSLLYQARQCLLQALQDRLALASGLVAGTEQVDDPQELAQRYAVQTSSRDFYLNLLFQEARDAATP